MNKFMEWRDEMIYLVECGDYTWPELLLEETKEVIRQLNLRRKRAFMKSVVLREVEFLKCLILHSDSLSVLPTGQKLCIQCFSLWQPLGLPNKACTGQAAISPPEDRAVKSSGSGDEPEPS